MVVLCSNPTSLRWRHNGQDSVSNHQPLDCLLNRLFRRRSKKTSKLRVTGLCVGNSPGTGEFPAQMASNAENVSIWWRHHVLIYPNDKSNRALVIYHLPIHITLFASANYHIIVLHTDHKTGYWKGAYKYGNSYYNDAPVDKNYEVKNPWSRDKNPWNAQ